MGERLLPSVRKDHLRMPSERRKTELYLPPIKNKMTEIVPLNCSSLKKYRETILDSYNDVLKDMQSKILYRAARRHKSKQPSYWKYKDKPGETVNIKNQFRRASNEVIWLRIVRSVTLMISAYGAMIKPFQKTEKISEKSIKREFQVRIGLRQSLHFNPSYFYRIRETVPKMCVIAMNKSSKIRKISDITLVYNVMMDMSIFHTKYTPEICWEMAKYFRYKKFKKKKILTKAHRKPLLVYFLYAGSVNLFYSVERDEDLMTVKSRNILLKPGACLGVGKKTRLCICATDCEFLTIDKETFESQGFSEVVKYEEEEKFEFFRCWLPIEDWSDNACYDLARASFIDNYPGDKLVLYGKHEKISDLIFFVVKGHVDVIKVTYADQCRNVVIKPTESCTYKQAQELQNQFRESMASGKRRSTSPSELCEIEEAIDEGKVTHRESIDNYTLDSDRPLGEVAYKGMPMYLRIHTLSAGDSYGLGKLKIEDLADDCGRFSLISRNSTIIRTPCTELRDSIETLGINMAALRKSCFVYDSDDVLCGKAKLWSRNERLIERMRYQYFPKCDSRASGKGSTRKDKSTFSHVSWRDFV